MKAAQETTERELTELKKDHETEIRELKADMERKISDAQKDAALSCANEVAKKEREMNAMLREADKRMRVCRCSSKACRTRLQS